MHEAQAKGECLGVGRGAFSMGPSLFKLKVMDTVQSTLKGWFCILHSRFGQHRHSITCSLSFFFSKCQEGYPKTGDIKTQSSLVSTMLVLMLKMIFAPSTCAVAYST